MGCTYTGRAGGPTRTEMPIPISACDAVESDNTETVNIKTPNANPYPNLRTERFIFIALPVAQLFWPKTGEPASLRFAHMNPEPSSLLRGQRKLFRMRSLVGCSTNHVGTAALGCPLQRGSRLYLRSSIFQNDVSQGFLGSMGNRERDIFRAELGRDDRRLTVKLNSRTLPLRAHHFDIAPADAATPSRAQRLHPRFLGGQPRGIAFKAAGFSFAVTNFALSEDATKKAVAKPLDGFADARNFGDVYPGA